MRDKKEIAYKAAELYHQEVSRYSFIEAYINELNGDAEEAETFWYLMDAAVDIWDEKEPIRL